MKRNLKNLFILSLVITIFLLNTIRVYASMLSINDVSKQFENSSVVQGLSQFGMSITSKVDSENKTLDINNESEKIFSFVYTDDYIEYSNRDTVITEDNCTDDIATAMWVVGIMESVFTLSGYEEKTLSDDANYNDYDTYGIQLETEDYEFVNSDEDGGTWTTSGDYIRYFKITLDTEKIDTLISKYGVDQEEQDPNKKILADFVPTLEAKNITENSVTLYPKVLNYYNTDSNYKVNCYIYRSDSEDGVYKKISDVPVNCLDSVGMVDEGLKSNTTYYYKAIIDVGKNYSDILSVTTKSSSTGTGDIAENPNTGSKYSFIVVILVVFGSITLALYTKKQFY